MHRLSANTTLVWKLFVPIFFGTFVGLLCIIAYAADTDDMLLLGNPLVRFGLIIAYVATMITFWYTIADLKRVEADDQYIYVSNYLKSYRYKKEDIVEEYTKNFLLFKVNTYVMKEKTTMGKKIRFIGDKSLRKI
jgi:hypothetical protein